MGVLRRFGRIAFIYAIGNVALRGASFLLIPVFAHYFSVRDYGLLLAMLMTVQIMLLFMNMGMRVTLLRFVKEYENESRSDELLGTTLAVNLLGGGGVIAGVWLFFLPILQVVHPVEDIGTCVVLMGLSALSQSLCQLLMSYYRAREEAVKFMFSGLAAAVVALLVNILFLYVLDGGIKGVFIAQIIAYFFIFLVLSSDILPKTGLAFSRFVLAKVLRFGYPVVISSFGQSILWGSGIYFLSAYSDLETVAIFALGVKLTQVLEVALIMPFQLAYPPFVFANIESPDIKEKMARLLTYLVMSISFSSLFLLLGYKGLLPLIATSSYSDSYLVILFLVPAIVFKGVTCYGEVFLLLVKKTNITGLIFGSSAVLCLAMNYLLTGTMGIGGAIISMSVSYFAAAVLLMYFGLKHFYVKIEWKRISISCGIFTGFLCLIYFYNKSVDQIFYSVGLSAGLGSLLLIYFSSFFDVREKAVIRAVFHRKVRGVP